MNAFLTTLYILAIALFISLVVSLAVVFYTGIQDLANKELLVGCEFVQVEVTSLNIAGLERVDTFKVATIYENIHIDSNGGSYNMYVKYRHPDNTVTYNLLKPAIIEIINYREL